MRKAALFTVLLFAASASPAAMAITAQEGSQSGDEREALARAVEEFEAIDRLIARAEASRTVGARVSFDYEALRNDLAAVRLGISRYLDEPRPQPRRFEPLSASYVVVAPAP